MQTKYYRDFNEDFVTNRNQGYKLKEDYKWVHKNIFYNILSFIVYLFILLISFIYMKLILKSKTKNVNLLKKEKGYFLYGNHTHTLGDVFNPFLVCFPNRPRIICSPSNLGIPIIGKILPLAGAMPIPKEISKTREFIESINYYTQKGDIIVIYPEAHLWPYCTFIRPLSKSSFHFPVENDKKSFTVTTTYRKRKISKKPKITYYVDGPIKNIKSFSKRENINNVHDEVFNSFKNKEKYNTYNYIYYKKKDD